MNLLNAKLRRKIDKMKDVELQGGKAYSVAG
jgi:hypothetical protein